jgi:hypothetical protein
MGADRENLCRRAHVSDSTDFPWVIEAQGLPNLIHEVVHALFLGRLADDHGFDYGQIPLDLTRADHRRHLWEEIACCVISAALCAPFEVDSERFTREWFAEQFEIQGVFHGLEHDLIGFRARIEAQLARGDQRVELTQTIEEARGLLAEALAAAGASPEVPACDGLEIWSSYQQSWSSTVQRDSR